MDHVWRYVHFLYTKPIVSKASPCTAATTAREAELTLLCRLYVLGEKFQDVNFKNAVIDAMVPKYRKDTEQGHGCSPHGADTSIAYGGTRAGSPGWRLMLEMHLRGGLGSTHSDRGPYDVNFLVELCVVLLEDHSPMRGKEVGPDLADSTLYHEALE